MELVKALFILLLSSCWATLLLAKKTDQRVRRDVTDGGVSGIFMASRGKKDGTGNYPIGARSPLDVNHQDAFLFSESPTYWSVEKKDGDDRAGDGDVPFWAARGKKDGEGRASDVPFWAARGKKDGENRADEVPFWAARGKKDAEDRTDEVPFWAARGKKDGGNSGDDVPFWAARGKKYGDGRADDVPFWAARGKKDGEDRTDEVPFWAARGRRDDANFWASRGRKSALPGLSSDVKYSLLGHRGPRYGPLDAANKFWAPRGKKGNEEMEDVAIQLPFWATRGKRTSVDVPVTNQLRGEMAIDDQDSEDDEEEPATESKREKRSLLAVDDDPLTNAVKASSSGGQRIRNRAVRPDPSMMLNSFWASRGKKK